MSLSNLEGELVGTVEQRLPQLKPLRALESSDDVSEPLNLVDYLLSEKHSGATSSCVSTTGVYPPSSLPGGRGSSTPLRETESVQGEMSDRTSCNASPILSQLVSWSECRRVERDDVEENWRQQDQTLRTSSSQDNLLHNFLSARLFRDLVIKSVGLNEDSCGFLSPDESTFIIELKGAVGQFQILQGVLSGVPDFQQESYTKLLQLLSESASSSRVADLKEIITPPVTPTRVPGSPNRASSPSSSVEPGVELNPEKSDSSTPRPSPPVEGARAEKYGEELATESLFIFPNPSVALPETSRPPPTVFNPLEVLRYVIEQWIAFYEHSDTTSLCTVASGSPYNPFLFSLMNVSINNIIGESSARFRVIASIPGFQEDFSMATFANKESLTSCGDVEKNPGPGR